MQSSIVKHNKIDVSKIVYEDFILANGEKHMISKIWYQDNENIQPHTFYIQTSVLKVHEVNNDSILFALDNTELYDTLDKVILGKIKATEITKKCGLKKTIFKSITNDVPDNKNLTVLNFKIGNCQFFSNSTVPKKYADVKHLIKCGASMKIIFEIDKIIVDIKKNFIFTNIILTQAQIKLTPNKIELNEYSFIDGDSETETENAKKNKNINSNINDAMLSNHTEYMEKEDVNSDNESVSEDTDSGDDCSDSTESESEKSGSGESVDIGSLFKHINTREGLTSSNSNRINDNNTKSIKTRAKSKDF